MILLAATLTEGSFGHVVYAARTFFGVYRVRVDEARGYRFMVHGTTLHGMQRLDAGRSDEPLSYFHRTGPIGQIFAALPQASTASDVAVVGLGVGTLASYRAPSQHWTFYEIDPIVERIARNTSYFTYLSRCGAECTVITGDGRVSLAQEAPQKFGVIVLDLQGPVIDGDAVSGSGNIRPNNSLDRHRADDAIEAVTLRLAA